MADEQRAWTEADVQSLDAKWQSFVASLSPAEQALLEQRLAGADADVQGFINTDPPGGFPKSNPARPRPRPGSSAQPPR